MSTETQKQDKLVTMAGKEKALKNLFTSVFGYLAVGYNIDTNGGNGFVNPSDENPNSGFNEITLEEDSTYHRVPLTPNENVKKNPETGEVTVSFLAELDVDNIIDSNIPINQIAIFDSEEVGSGTMYCAGTSSDFPKNEELALIFVIDMMM